ncbi:glucosylceramidase [Flaviaesturariibacter amylovorans]|uniref:Glucosylceramidase n=1 Tax=Flaviaesturariibacter amylovorans TaxID=1084520 RepID=A0ABP8H0R1_9BACT
MFPVLAAIGCSAPSGAQRGIPAPDSLRAWVTTHDGAQLLAPLAAVPFGDSSTAAAAIRIDPSLRYQAMEGFGYTLTGGSAALIGRLDAPRRRALLQELFGRGPGSIGINYLRLSIGASDLDSAVFSYNDLPVGATDTALAQFSLAPDRRYLIPLLRDILEIAPAIRIMASPWSPPVWMKDNRSSIGGSLLPQFYGTYARYFIKYLQGMAAEGIRIDAVTPQNEPLHPGNNPSLLMLPDQQAAFIRAHLGPALRAAGLQTKILIYDHNADRPDYPLSVLADAGARQFISGTAFHLYGGPVEALSAVHNAHPDKGIYFTEQWTGSKGAFGGDLHWHIKNLIIGAPRNWSRTVLEWNLANDPAHGPHTPGGCTECKGALTIGPGGITRNVSYYIIGHASKFVGDGSVRIGSTGAIPNVAFQTPEGRTVLILQNEDPAVRRVTVRAGGRDAELTLPPGSVATCVW